MTDPSYPGPAILGNPAYYQRFSDYDFASVIALGLVPETKFTVDPRPTNSRYTYWFGLYLKYKFSRMTWLNVPYGDWNRWESYCLKDERGNVFYR